MASEVVGHARPNWSSFHDLQENLDGSHNRGHKQTDLIIRLSIRYPIND